MTLEFLDKDNSSSPTLIIKDKQFVYKIGINYNYMNCDIPNDFYGVVYEADVYEHLISKSIDGTVLPILIKKKLRFHKLIHILNISSENIINKIINNIKNIYDDNIGESITENKIRKRLRFVLLKFDNMYTKGYITLSEYIKNNKYNEKYIQLKILPVIKKVKNILDEYGKIKLVHNDVRTSNIFIKWDNEEDDKTLEVLLYDFDRSAINFLGRNLSCVRGTHSKKYVELYDLYKFLYTLLYYKLQSIPFDKNIIFFMLVKSNRVNENFYKHILRHHIDINEYIEYFNSHECIEKFIRCI